jgi:hypothetical protein
VDFPWDTTRALELALFRTFASPRIGGLLHATGEFAARAAKRYDDTDLIVSEIVENGFDSERGGRAIARMNAIHARFKIRNVDFLYVLSTFALEPIRWNARFGWRRMTESERLGWFWREVGARMGLQDLPVDLDAFERFNRDYEEAEFRPGAPGAAVGAATRALFMSWFPRPLRPLVRRSIDAMLDDRLREAFGWPAPTPRLKRTVAAALRARALLVRLLPARRRPRLRTLIGRADYPGGYRIESLGPPPAS